MIRIRKSRGRRFATGAVVVLALVAAACGSDDDADSGDTTAGTTATADTAAGEDTAAPVETAATEDTTATEDSTATTGTEATDEPVELSGDPVKVFSIITPATGDNARAGLELGVEVANLNGGVQGHPIELTICEDKEDPNIAAQCARDAVADGAIAEISRSMSYGATVNPILIEAGVPTLGGGLFSAADFAAENLYPFGSGILSTVGSGVLAVKQDLKRVGVPYIDVPAGAALAPTLEPLITPLGGEISAAIPVPPTVADVTSYVAAIIESEPDVVIDGLVLGTYAAFINETRNQGGEFPFFVSSGLGDPMEIQDAIGEGVEGILINSQVDHASEGYADFLADYAEYSDFPHYGDTMSQGYFAFKLLQDVGNAATELTPAAMTESIKSLTDWTYKGYTPPIDFSQPGTAMGGNAPRLFNDVQFLFTLENGEFVPVGDGEGIHSLT